MCKENWQYIGVLILSLPFPSTAIGGSGSTYIYGLVDHKFKEGMTKDEAKALVEKSIAHAMARDGSSGGIIRTVVITEGGCDKEFIPGDKLPFGP